MTSGSVKALREAGINARTIASLLENPLSERAARELWMVDESSLLATRSANGILKAAREQGIERIVFVGDQRQHHPIEAGAPVRQFLANNLALAELQVIRRQRDPELKRAVELAAHGRPDEALSLLEQQQRVAPELPDAAARYQRIAADYLRGHEAGQTTLVVSPGNDERRTLNQEIRKMLVEHGHVAAQGRQHGILVRRDLTPAQFRCEHYQEGEVIHFDRAHKKRGIDKDSYLTVATVNRAGNSLTLRAGDGR